jgi:hypothetical protein
VPRMGSKGLEVEHLGRLRTDARNGG